MTRGPSLIAGEKRLAVRTEDHPMQYLDFEGNIPKGEYGGGAMIVWDRGRWEPAFDAEKGLAKGHLDITLHGQRLNGRWHLVRMRKRPGEKNEQWLLIKSEDEFARRAGEPDITDEETTSMVSGLTTEELAAQGELRKDHAGRAKVIGARTTPLPDAADVRGIALRRRARDPRSLQRGRAPFGLEAVRRRSPVLRGGTGAARSRERRYRVGHRHPPSGL